MLLYFFVFNFTINRSTAAINPICNAIAGVKGPAQNTITAVTTVSHHGLKKLNINAVYFCPIFESSAHGYDTSDFSKTVDKALGAGL